ncbi:MAG: right-handed parallel beta-helix repeat-containing protein [Flavobacteriales bacterium]|nr:right-handed parallel beta-helix repeat-containing protein [Flavobacteriales bacterium]
MRILLCSFSAAAALGLNAATYHVAVSGSNAANGLTLSTAWATVQHAADMAIAGDSVLVHPGSYAGFAAMDNSGTANAPIVLMSTGGVVNITSPCSYNNLDGINVEDVSWVVIEGFTVVGMPRTGIRTALTDHITLRGNTCADNGKWGILTGFAEHIIIEHNACSGSLDEHGIYFSNSADDPIIRFNHCFDNNANGIHMNGDVSLGGDGVISNAQVYGNTIHGNGTAGGSGINCDGVVNSVIYNNLLFDNHASGISLYQIDAGAPSTGNRVYNNTIVNANNARWCINITDDCTDNQLRNNILINQHPFRGSIVVAASALPGFSSDFNLVMERLSPDGDATILNLASWQALGYDANSQVVQAQAQLFVQPGIDHHPLSTSAQMVDAGTAAVSPFVSTDLDGAVRPSGVGYDIGCYEAALATGWSDDPPTSGTTLTFSAADRRLRGAVQGDRCGVLDALGRLCFEGPVSGPDVILPELGRGVRFLRITDHAGALRSTLKVWSED